MKKIPLESTIVGSYKFLFTRIVSIIGVMWLPALLMAALVVALISQIVPHEWCQGKFDPHQIKDVVLSNLPLIVSGGLGLLIASILVRSMIIVGILRHALGEKTSTSFIYFSLGERVWLMAVVVLLGIIVYVLLEIAAAILFGVAAAIMAAIPDMPLMATSAINLVIGVVVVVTIVYVMLRMFFFLPAVVVAEKRLGVGRAWALGKGNVLRMIAVLIVILIPVAIVAGAVFYVTVVPTVILEAVRQHPHSPEEAMAFLKTLWPLLPVLGAINLVAVIAITGLTFGAMGHAYNAVTAPDEPAEAPKEEEASA